MKKIYLDSSYRCHVTNDGTMAPVETDAFDGYCDEYIEGYRYIPAGATWARPDGVVFTGEMISPATDWAALDAAQRAYEHEQYLVLSAENAELVEAMAAMVDDIYNQDMEQMEE